MILIFQKKENHPSHCIKFSNDLFIINTLMM